MFPSTYFKIHHHHHHSSCHLVSKTYSFFTYSVFTAWVWLVVAIKAVLTNVLFNYLTSINQYFYVLKVHEVTEKDIEDATFSLRDVVLPLPGNRVRFPPNMESYYLNSLIKDGVLSDGSDRKSSFRINKLRLNCPGSYRKLIEYPENLHFRLVQIRILMLLQNNVFSLHVFCAN